MITLVLLQTLESASFQTKATTLNYKISGSSVLDASSIVDNGSVYGDGKYPHYGSYTEDIGGKEVIHQFIAYGPGTGGADADTLIWYELGRYNSGDTYATEYSSHTAVTDGNIGVSLVSVKSGLKDHLRNSQYIQAQTTGFSDNAQLEYTWENYIDKDMKTAGTFLLVDYLGCAIGGAGASGSSKGARKIVHDGVTYYSNTIQNGYQNNAGLFQDYKECSYITNEHDTYSVKVTVRDVNTDSDTYGKEVSDQVNALENASMQLSMEEANRGDDGISVYVGETNSFAELYEMAGIPHANKYNTSTDYSLVSPLHISIDNRWRIADTEYADRVDGDTTNTKIIGKKLGVTTVIALSAKGYTGCGHNQNSYGPVDGNAHNCSSVNTTLKQHTSATMSMPVRVIRRPIHVSYHLTNVASQNKEVSLATGDDYTTKLTPNAGYVLGKFEVAVKCDSNDTASYNKVLENGTDYTYDAATGELHVDSDVIPALREAAAAEGIEWKDDMLSISAEAKAGATIYLNNDNDGTSTGSQAATSNLYENNSFETQPDSDNKVVHIGGTLQRDNVVLQLVAKEGYVLPQSIEIQAGSDIAKTALSTDDYTYDPVTGCIYIPKESQKGNYYINAAAIKNDTLEQAIYYDVTLNGVTIANQSQTNGVVVTERTIGEDKANSNALYNTTILQTSNMVGYDFSIDKIFVGGAELTSNQYSYRENDGCLVIPKEKVTGNIDIITKNVFPIVLDKNCEDSSVHDGAASVQYKAGETFGQTNVGERAGYAFDGYYTEASGGMMVLSKDGQFASSVAEYTTNEGKWIGTKSTISGTLYAHWFKLCDTTLNGKSQSTGTAEDHLKAIDGTIGSEKAVSGQAFTTTLTADSGYTLPKTIKIEVGGFELQAADYTYNSRTGEIVIFKENVTGDINIVAVAMKELQGSQTGATPTPAPTQAPTSVPTQAPTTPQTEQKKSIEENIPTIILSKCMGYNMKFKVMFKNTSKAKIVCESSNKSIAKVSKNGLVTTKRKSGKTKIIVNARKGKHIVQYIINLRVTKGQDQNYSLTKYTVKYKYPTAVLYRRVYKGAKYKIKLKNVSKDAKVTYKTSNKKVATVSSKGLVKGKKAGRTNVTVTIKQNGITYRYYVVVRVDAGKVSMKNIKYLKIIK